MTMDYTVILRATDDSNPVYRLDVYLRAQSKDAAIEMATNLRVAGYAFAGEVKERLF